MISFNLTRRFITYHLFTLRSSSTFVRAYESSTYQNSNHIVDFKRILCTAGTGGDGGLHFQKHAKHTRMGPGVPVGGVGGTGGSVIATPDEQIKDFGHIVSDEYIAQDGGKGRKFQSGTNGSDELIKVPYGTEIIKEVYYYNGQEISIEKLFEILEMLENRSIPFFQDSWPPGIDRFLFPDNEEDYSLFYRRNAHDDYVFCPMEFLFFLFPDFGKNLTPCPITQKRVTVAYFSENNNTSQHVLCFGGKGGVGNLKTAYDIRKPGDLGDQNIFRFEITMLAHVGLVGYPNAGKSTLLANISRATPEVSPKPFTTLAPILGTVKLPGKTNLRDFIVADLPGIVEGGTDGGVNQLGSRFLRHISRCLVVVIVIDVRRTRDLMTTYSTIRREMLDFDYDSFHRKPVLIVCNKIDEIMQSISQQEKSDYCFEPEELENCLKRIDEFQTVGLKDYHYNEEHHLSVPNVYIISGKNRIGINSFLIDLGKLVESERLKYTEKIEAVREDTSEPEGIYLTNYLIEDN